jgi:hypothetical protein
MCGNLDWLRISALVKRTFATCFENASLKSLTNAPYHHKNIVIQLPS